MNLNIEDIETLNDWIDFGGIIWCESDEFFPCLMRLYHTTDDGIIRDMYIARNEEFKEMDIETYCKAICKQTLENFNVLEEYRKYLEW